MSGMMAAAERSMTLPKARPPFLSTANADNSRSYSPGFMPDFPFPKNIFIFGLSIAKRIYDQLFTLEC